MEEFSFNNDTEINIDIDKIMASLDTSEINPIHENMNDFTKNIESGIDKYNKIKNNNNNNNILLNPNNTNNILVNNNNLYNLFNNNKEIILYTVIFIILSINIIPFINKFENKYFNLIIKTFIFIFLLYIIKKYKKK